MYRWCVRIFLPGFCSFWSADFEFSKLCTCCNTSTQTLTNDITPKCAILTVFAPYHVVELDDAHLGRIHHFSIPSRHEVKAQFPERRGIFYLKLRHVAGTNKTNSCTLCRRRTRPRRETPIDHFLCFLGRFVKDDRLVSFHSFLFFTLLAIPPVVFYLTPFNHLKRRQVHLCGRYPKEFYVSSVTARPAT